MLDSIYHMILKSNKNCIFGMKTSEIFPLLCNIIMTYHCLILKLLAVY